MNHVNNRALLVKIHCLVVSLTALVLLVGCEEANLAIDNVLGRKSPLSLAAASDGARLTAVFAKKQPAGAMPSAP
ncbi:MAG: hypothetical protein FJY85_09995, partial [Deltaproteobacteria bacterium]|nr:hypothetical protein [Deltaproteobacteria bacterium]